MLAVLESLPTWIILGPGSLQSCHSISIVSVKRQVDAGEEISAA